MMLSRRTHSQTEIGQLGFGRLETFKLLGVGLDATSGGHDKVQRIISNRYFDKLRLLFKSIILPKNSKITMKELILPIAL